METEWEVVETKWVVMKTKWVVMETNGDLGVLEESDMLYESSNWIIRS